MSPAKCGLTPEGYPVIFLTALASVVFALCGCITAAIAFLILCWFCLHFFRDPERVIPTEKGILVSPADGKVVCLQKRMDPMSGETRICVGIFMSVFNVHVNRAPDAGIVEKITYWPGKYFNASLDKASEHNERCGFCLRLEDGQSVSFVQIAGLIARRIVCRVEEGDKLARGERFGMIRFGSRVDLYLPTGYTPSVSMGEAVLAGQTVLARKRQG